MDATQPSPQLVSAENAKQITRECTWNLLQIILAEGSPAKGHSDHGWRAGPWIHANAAPAAMLGWDFAVFGPSSIKNVVVN